MFFDFLKVLFLISKMPHFLHSRVGRDVIYGRTYFERLIDKNWEKNDFTFLSPICNELLFLSRWCLILPTDVRNAQN